MRCQCTKCKEWKSSDDFYKDHRWIKERHPWCKDCFLRQQREYRQEHLATMRARDSHPNRLARRRELRREQRLVFSPQRLEEHRLKRRTEQRAYLSRLKADPKAAGVYRKNQALVVARRRSRKAGLPDSFTGEQRDRVLSEFGGVCPICSAELEGAKGGNLHWDHLLPISLGGGTILGNMAPLCNMCNWRKNDKTLVEFCWQIASERRVA